MIDTHAHIYLEEFRDDLGEIIDRCQSAGIKKIYMPNIDSRSIENMLETESRYPGYCLPMMGLHPGSVKDDFQRELYIVEDWLSRKKFAAIGEIGIDLHWDTTFSEQQKEAFRVQVQLAKKHGLPIVIHNRKAFQETYGIVESMAGDDRFSGIFHCFTGSKEEADKITSLGFYAGIGGVVTYKNGGLDKVVPELDLGHIVLETDSPYLSPVPHRGRRNEPVYLKHIAERIAFLKGCAFGEVAAATSDNAEKVFAM